MIFPAIGLDGGLWLCIGVDVAVALAVFGLMWRTRGEAGAPTGAVTQAPNAFPALLAIAFTSGLVFFALEVLWTHIVAAAINSSVYAFSSMLFFVTLGLALGSRAAAETLRRGKRPMDLGFLFLACAGVLTVQILLWPAVPGSMASMGKTASSFLEGELIRWLHLGLMLLPVTFLFGMVYPSLFRDSRFSGENAAALVGRLGAVNAAGCVLGALLASFVLIPAWGSEASLRAVVAVALCGLAVTLLEGGRRRTAAIAAAAVTVFAVITPAWNRLQLTSGLNVYFKLTNVKRDSKLLSFHEDAYGGITTVVETPEPGGTTRRVLLTNGKFQGDDGQQKDAQLAFTGIPSMHLAQWSDALVIGFGTGHSAGVLRGLGYQRVRVAEMAPGILAASGRYFRGINKAILEAPNVTVHVDDGRNVLLAHPHPLDLISIEITSVWFAGATNVYSHEFYELVRDRLKAGGRFQQWIQLHHISPREVESILGTVQAVFPHVSLWLFGGQGVIVASKDEHRLLPDRVAALKQFLVHELGGERQAESYMHALLRSKLVDSGAMRRLLQRGPVINTDWNRFLEYATPRYALSSADWPEINLRHLARLSGDAPASPIRSAVR